MLQHHNQPDKRSSSCVSLARQIVARELQPSDHSPTVYRPNQTVQITHITPVNRYAFSWHNLLLAYGLAVSATLLANILGLIAYHLNKAAHDGAISTIISVTRSDNLLNLFPHCSQGPLPVPKETLAAPLKIRKSKNGGLSLEPTQSRRMSVCDACLRRAQGPRERRRSSLRSGRRVSVVYTVVAPASKSKKWRQYIWRRMSANASAVKAEDTGEKAGVSVTAEPVQT